MGVFADEAKARAAESLAQALSLRTSGWTPHPTCFFIAVAQLPRAPVAMSQWRGIRV